MSRLAHFKIPTSVEACSDAPQNLKFEREDWTAFRTLNGLQRRAGVTESNLSKLVLKELADNALDAGAMAKVGELVSGGYFVEDDGPGIDGTPQEIARLFSIARPLVSTKLLRVPTRGALGNGLRVVAGAVLASEGKLTVMTRNLRLELRPERDGSTTVVSAKPVDFPVGTRIEIRFGPALDGYIRATSWADTACQLARHGRDFTGKTSPYWYDVAEFRELLDASGDLPVRELISQFDGCSGAKAGEIVAAARLSRATCRKITGQQAATLLKVARDNARQVSHSRLGAIGPDLTIDGRAMVYAAAEGIAQFGSGLPKAEIPYIVEAWASQEEEGWTVAIACVNKTPVTGRFDARRDKRDIDFFGCGIRHTVAAAAVTAQFFICLNIITPFMPITSDGKEPDFAPFLREIRNAVGKAVRKAHRPGSDGKTSQKSIVLEHMDAVIAEEGGHRFNERQIFYGLRPIVRNELAEELRIGNFKAIITDYENEHGEIRGMYREPRGSLYHPHLAETITLGTLMVEEYERPAWLFNKLLYIEKEGANEALKDVRWPERHDCAVMSSKGFSTRAARDLIDKLAEHDEHVEVFCAHDADAYGTMIYETLQEATKARGARKIKIVNIGLEPWEAVAAGLEIEDVQESRDRNRPVADYVCKRDTDHPNEAPSGISWEKWLQTHRVELNAMTTPQFLEWLDRKMLEHGTSKLIPPADVLEDELEGQLEDRLREEITERILREARIDDQVRKALEAIDLPDGDELAKGIKDLFERRGDSEWRDHIETLVDQETKKFSEEED